jgi:hypothetical protein
VNQVQVVVRLNLVQAPLVPKVAAQAVVQNQAAQAVVQNQAVPVQVNQVLVLAVQRHLV